MTTRELSLGLGTQEHAALFEALLPSGLLQAGPDGVVERAADWTAIDGEDCDWSEVARRGLGQIEELVAEWLHGERRETAGAIWSEWTGRLEYRWGRHFHASNTRFAFTPASVLELLAGLPFTRASAGPHDQDIWKGRPKPLRRGLGHGYYGWMAAFRGDGHAALASRRYLDHGPWRLLRDEQRDITMVQLHDLDADEETAWQQGLASWPLMSIGDRGVVVQLMPRFAALKPAHYDRATRTSIALFNDRPPTPAEVQDAQAIKLHQPYDEPVDQVAFVFVDEAIARQQLPELWLRGLEVRAVIGGDEVVLSDDYEPPPHEPPDWVERLQDREGR